MTQPTPIPTVPPAAPVPATPVPAAPVSPAPANTNYTFQQEFDDPSAQLLLSNGGPFNPYFKYFGGGDSPDGFRWWNDEVQVFTDPAYDAAPYNPLSISNSTIKISAIPKGDAIPQCAASASICPGFYDGQGPTAGRCCDARQTGGFEQKYGYWERAHSEGRGTRRGWWLNGGVTSIPEANQKMGELDIFETIGDGKIYQTGHDWWNSADPY